MIRKPIISTTLILGSTLSSASHAYEVDTHAAVTRRAYDRSVLASAELKERLGWNRYIEERPFHAPSAISHFTDTVDAYWDVPSAAWTTQNWATYTRRKPQVFERNQFPGEYRSEVDGRGLRELEPLAWLMRGAVREDDLLTSSFTDDDDPPPDADPYGELIRVFHHFYDPVHDRPLSPVGLNCETLPLPGKA